jgi:Fe-S cluster biogenesis protein NfuA
VTADGTLAAAMTEVRALVQADGGDIVLTSIDGATVNLRLVVEGAHCVECVMPREFLEHVALDILRQNAPGIEVVRISDPREQPDYIPPED